MHIHVHTPEKVKVSYTRQIQRLIRLAHCKVTRVSREYCHLVYFGAVFIEGHGIYSIAGGVLLVFGVLGVIAGEEEGGVE